MHKIAKDTLHTFVGEMDGHCKECRKSDAHHLAGKKDPLMTARPYGGGPEGGGKYAFETPTN